MIKYDVDVYVLDKNNSITAVKAVNFSVEATSYTNALNISRTALADFGFCCEYFLVLTPYPF